MLIVALVLAVISLAALVTAVVTSNEVIAWVCIGFSGLGVLLLIVDAIRDRNRRGVRVRGRAADRTEVLSSVEEIEPVDYDFDSAEDDYDFDPIDDYVAEDDIVDYPGLVIEDHPDELINDRPDSDAPGDDEPVYPDSAEQAAVHVVGEDYLTEGVEYRTADTESYPEASYTMTYADVPAAEAYVGDSVTASAPESESYVVVYEAPVDDSPDDEHEAGTQQEDRGER